MFKGAQTPKEAPKTPVTVEQQPHAPPQGDVDIAEEDVDDEAG
jgi:hypothetical protein